MRDFISALQAALDASHRVERELGGGGKSRVFLAEEAALGRRVVVKVLEFASADPSGRERFAETLRLGRDVFEALAFAHTRGFVHRDVKPVDLLLTGSRAILADFGVVQILSSASGRHRLTGTGITLGTPACMAP